MNTKEKILRVSFNLFLQKGYKDVSLRQIVDAMGLTKGAFYHYFTGKEELFTQVMEIYLLEGGDKVYDGLALDNLNLFMTGYLQRVVAFMDKVQREIVSDDGQTIGLSYFYLAFDALRLIPGFDEKIKKVHEKEQNKWVEVIRNAKKNKEISTHISDLQLARMFIGLNDGLGMHLILEGRIDDVQGEIFNMWNAIYNMIKV